MNTSPKIVSPLMWVGGKFASAKRIVKAFPPPELYGTYVEVFGGAAHVLFHKAPGSHLEVYNDLNDDLVRFWMAARDQPEALQQRIDSLPYSRSLYHAYHASLRANAPMDDLERAARWFYVLRSTFGGVPDFSKGWGYLIGEGANRVSALRTATALLTVVAQRFRYVQIEHRDFAAIIQTYQTPRTLFYVDPPYIGCEDYYDTVDGSQLFTEDDHRRLATLLNATPAYVALSYYAHSLVDELYPAQRWRLLTWRQAKAVQKTREHRQYGREVLLMNYPETLGLWQGLA
ncbi:MAG TPA: DNA adenine methylase [Ktedonobacteraceae bacterium]|nr:DNA adenine methylase [Ktedonobacteraceae bacterium]HZU66235.1 DNA adenine methylase [Ktedonobacteraceae bacterium]